MTPSTEEQWSFARAAITRRQWEAHWRELDVTAATFTLRAPPRWTIERRLDHPSVAMRKRDWRGAWYVAVDLEAEDIGAENARYTVSCFRTSEVPLIPTRTKWYHRGPTVSSAQLQSKTFVEQLLDEAIAEIGRQMACM